MIREHLPKKGQKEKIDSRLVQVHLPRGFVERVEAEKEKDNLSWVELITACFEAYLQEAQKPTKRRAS